MWLAPPCPPMAGSSTNASRTQDFGQRGAPKGGPDRPVVDEADASSILWPISLNEIANGTGSKARVDEPRS